MTPTSQAQAALEYYIVSRGLYFRPDAQGYTGIRDEAGLYTKEVAESYTDCRVIHKDDAPEFMPLAYSDLVIAHLIKQLDKALSSAIPAEVVEKVGRALDESFEREYNSFEPDNQSAHYKRLQQALEALKPYRRENG